MAFTHERDIINAALSGLGVNPVNASYELAVPAETTEQAKLASATYSMHLEHLLASHPWNVALNHVVLDMALLPTGTWRWDYAYSLPSDSLRVWEVEKQSANIEDEWTVSDGLLLTNLEQTTSATVTAIDAGTDTCTSNNHGFSAGDVVIVNNIPGLTDDTVLYYVIAAGLTDNDFRLSTSAGGAAENLSAFVSNGTVTRRTVDIRYVKDETAVTAYSPQFITALVAKLESEWAEPLVKATTLGERKDLKFMDKLAESRSLDGQEGTPERQEVLTWLDER